MGVVSAAAALVWASRGAPPGRVCTSCKAPRHSWDTIPVSFHSAATTTGPDGRWSAADLEIISKFPLVTIEKWQGSSARDPATNAPVFLWEEDAWVAAAKQIKDASPNTSVVVWCVSRACHHMLQGGGFGIRCCWSEDECGADTMFVTRM